jgi:putative ABC transport system permease protein
MGGIPLAWLQLMREKQRFAVAVAGIAFAVILMLVQLGLRDALYESATKPIDHLQGDLIITSSQYEYLFSTDNFTQRRLYSALALDDVEWVAPLYLGVGTWRQPETYEERKILVLGFIPSTPVVDFPEVWQDKEKLEISDSVLFDSASRPEYGPVTEIYARYKAVVTEVNGKRIKVVGLFNLGPTFGSNAHLITSDLTFLRMFKNRQQGLIDLGFVKLKSGSDPEQARARLRAMLPQDVNVFTRQALLEQEKDYWNRHLPIGFIFNLGSLMGLVVGGVVVYQILFADVNDQLPEYATLKAMGYLDRDLFKVVLQEATILSALGFVPGYLVAQMLYIFAHDKAGVPIHMTVARVVIVFILTALTCGVSGAIAMRKLRLADPAEIF